LVWKKKPKKKRNKNQPFFKKKKKKIKTRMSDNENLAPVSSSYKQWLTENW